MVFSDVLSTYLQGNNQIKVHLMEDVYQYLGAVKMLLKRKRCEKQILQLLSWSRTVDEKLMNLAVDGFRIRHQLRLVVYPTIYRVFYIPGDGISSINSMNVVDHQSWFNGSSTYPPRERSVHTHWYPNGKLGKAR